MNDSNEVCLSKKVRGFYIEKHNFQNYVNILAILLKKHLDYVRCFATIFRM